MAVSFIPIAGPILSCVIDGTFVDMFKAIMKGDWATVGLCALAFVPGMKGVGKSLKALGAVEKGVGKAAKAGAKGEKLFAKSNFRKNLIEVTGKNPGKSMEAHHVLPQKFQKLFKSSGVDNIHNPKYGSWWETAGHRQNAYAYNKDWKNFFGGTSKDPNEVLNFAKGLGKKYGFDINF